MAVENWPQIAERVAWERGGVPFTGERPVDKWGYRLVATGVACRGSHVELGRFAFPTDPGWQFNNEVMARLAAEDGMTEVTVYPLGKPTA